MWIMLNDAFFSIVDKSKESGCLLVRARRTGDIQRHFPNANVRRISGSDYLYRADVPRAEVAKVITKVIQGINYDNFKDSVRDDRLHSAYNGVWHVMARLQPVPPYSRGTTGALL